MISTDYSDLDYEQRQEVNRTIGGVWLGHYRATLAQRRLRQEYGIATQLVEVGPARYELRLVSVKL